MRFVDHVPDHEVTRLVYRHLPSWHAVGCYFDWRKHYAQQMKDADFAKAKASRAGRALARQGAVLTDAGWVLPSGPTNPRIIDEPGTELMSPREIAKQERIDAEVNYVRQEHETAVLDEDLAGFGRQWLAIVDGDADEARLLIVLDGHSEQREAFMARWHADRHPR